jgi:hypothetical protein
VQEGDNLLSYITKTDKIYLSQKEHMHECSFWYMNVNCCFIVQADLCCGRIFLQMKLILPMVASGKLMRRSGDGVAEVPGMSCRICWGVAKRRPIFMHKKLNTASFAKV